MLDCDLDYFREKFSKKELTPTEITEQGESYLYVSRLDYVVGSCHRAQKADYQLKYLLEGPRNFGYYRLIELFLKIGFCPSFCGLTGL